MDANPRQYDNIAMKESDVHSVVLSYLVHNCFGKTVESFTSSTGMQLSVDSLEWMEKRKGILQCALDGNVLMAIELTGQLAPDLFEKNMDLHFDLLSLRFIELVLSRKSTEALEFAQSKLTPFGKVQKHLTKLQDFIALLAYEEPEKSPMFYLLSSDYRQQVTDDLNQAILEHAKLPGHSALERLIQQTAAVRECLSQERGKEGHPPFSLKDFIKS